MRTTPSTKQNLQFAICKVDQEIIRIITLNRFAHFKDLERDLKGLPPGYNLFRRLRHLQKIDLIESLIGDGGAKLGYRLSRKGIEYAKQLAITSDIVLQSRPAFRTHFDHDRIVNETRGILLESPIVRDFITETELRSRLGKCWQTSQNDSNREWKVPDALFTLETARGPMTTALEVELTQKAKARYAKIVQALLTSKMFHLVFILCKDEKLATVLRNEIAEARAMNPFVRVSNRSNGIYFCNLAVLREKQLDALWEGEDRQFSINEIAETLKEKDGGNGKSEVSVK